MVSTPFVLAQFTGQTANSDLSTYVPQSGDLNAVFARTSDSATTTSLVFRSPTGLKSVATASGTVDVRYTAGQAITSAEGIDFSLDFSTGAAVLPGGQVGGFTFGDDGTTNRVNLFVNWTGTTPTLAMENVVNGTKTNLFVSVAFPSGAAFALNTAYTLTVEVRGSAGAYTANVYLALRGGTQAQVSTANRSIPSLVLAGRKAGLRVATFGVTNPGNDTNGMFFDKFTASDYSATGTGAPAPSFTTQPTISPASGAPNSTFTATPGTVSNGSVTSRVWLLNGTSISTGLTAVPSAEGTLTYQEFATGGGGSASSVIRSATVTSGTTTPPSTGTPSFSIITTPASVALRQGESLTLLVSGTPSNGYAANPALSVSGLPTGVTASFSASSLTGGAGSSTLTLTAAGNAITGAVEFLVRASDGTITRTVPVLLQVNPPSGIVYPVVSNILSDDLITITRGGATDQVAASVLKAYLAP
jgi:hypothetical protein